MGQSYLYVLPRSFADARLGRQAERNRWQRVRLGGATDRACCGPIVQLSPIFLLSGTYYRMTFSFPTRLTVNSGPANNTAAGSQ